MRFVSAIDPACQGALAALDRRLAAFYNSSQIAEYFRRASEANRAWDESGPHGIVLALAGPGKHVLEMGCGSAVGYEHLRALGIEYTGVDWSAEQIARNAERFPEARFICTTLYETGLADGMFDVVFSTYVLEHLVWPHRALREMARLVKPGGVIVVICPHYRRAGRCPSLPFGGPGSFREKLAAGCYGQAVLHFFYRFWWPLVVGMRREPFLINLRPRCFVEPNRPDNDAVYLPERGECLRLLGALGFADITGEFSVRIPREVCVIAARRVV
ncbi:MAG: class I SAM-dependent methyltransferase [Verrucomicrobiae bacterium]|nr:class I SAM-dependent methyltransferase [Verrucomicrobiae bacterium]